ncbi:MAG TPA: 6-phosphogluconolactonase [Candidatus Limnocylindrales bacterium]|nr:6-phosphogluconolactonase [Candidatus Limnocylindrales bacterium]
MNIRVCDDIDAVSRAAMDETMGALREAVEQRGRFAIALSGGHTPAKMYALWASEPYRSETPWDRAHLFWSDERYVPPDDPLSNFRMTREALISRVPIPAANVHAVPTTLPTPQAAADAYEKDLRNFFGASAPQFDVQLLGLGPEGHTASLFPGSAALAEKNRWVLPVEVDATPPRRLTFTPVVLNQGRKTMFLVAGKDKREIVSALRNEPDAAARQYPAAQIRPNGDVLWLLDRAAAG